MAIAGKAQSTDTPAIVDQTNRQPETSRSLYWGSNEKWLASFRSGAATIDIYDLENGRLLHQLAAADPESEILVLPQIDQISVSSPTGLTDITVYNVRSGEKLYSLASSSGCATRVAVGAEIKGECARRSGDPTSKVSITKVWAAGTGKLLRQEPLSASAIPANGTLEDGTWTVQQKTGVTGRQIAKSLARIYFPTSNDPSMQFSMLRFAITDTRTGSVIMEGDGMPRAISQKARSAIVMTSKGSFVIEVPSGRRLKKIGDIGMSAFIDGSYSAKTVLDGKYYFLSGLQTSRLVNAATGEIGLTWRLPSRMEGTLSPNGDRMAYPQGEGILIVNIPETSQQQLIGNKTAAAYIPNDVPQGSQNSEADADMLKSVPSVPDLKARQKKARTEERAAAKKEMKEELAFEKKLPKFNNKKRAALIQDHYTAKRGKATAGSTSRSNSAELTKQYAAEYLRSSRSFGTPAAIPPEAAFLDSGNVMAVLSADFSWNMWDTRTGDHLAFRTINPDYSKLAESATSDTSGLISFPAMYGYLHDELNAAAQRDSRKVAAIGTNAPPRALNMRACSSSDGGYLLDLKMELDPKQWKTGKHRVVSAVLRSRVGGILDLTSKNIDFLDLGDGQSCALSVDGQFLALPKSHQASTTKVKNADRQTAEPLPLATEEGIALYATATGRKTCDLEGSGSISRQVSNLKFSNGKVFLSGDLTTTILWDSESCKKLIETPGTGLAVSDFPRRFYVGMHNQLRTEMVGYGIEIFDVTSGSKTLTLPDAAADGNIIKTTKNGRILFDADRNNALGFWDLLTGQRLASMRVLQEGEWFITTPAGYFDGSPRGWTQIAWRLPGEAPTQPGEIFFNEFYRPGLLSEMLQGRRLIASRDIANVDRRQPDVTLSSTAVRLNGNTAQIMVSVKEAPPDSDHKAPSGVRDVRLFRNGILAKVWHGPVSLSNGAATLEAEVPVTSGSNEFVAYAFNHDNVKSRDTALTVTNTRPKLPGRTYVLAIGVNQYSNHEFNLKFAVPDAEVIAQRFAESQGRFAMTEAPIQIILRDAEASKANILLALALLAGTHKGELPPNAPQQLEKLKTAQPEDTLLVYFAGHGIARDDRFYLVPHDLGYGGSRSAINDALPNILKSSISDQNLEDAFEPIQAGHSLLIVDACNSGKALDSEEQRRGPMNNRGLAQLAYEKGMYVLTASQGYQAALESSHLGHGYLTYALAEEGLKSPAADTGPSDGKISAMEWFEYATQRVPELQLEALRQAKGNGRLLTFEVATGTESADTSSLQTPRLYYRRDLSGSDLIVAKLQ